MESKTSKTERRSVPLAEFAADIDRRRTGYEERLGRPFDIPRNSGKRRTASKRALLKAVEDLGGQW
jgi:hypothetical protein